MCNFIDKNICFFHVKWLLNYSLQFHEKKYIVRSHTYTYTSVNMVLILTTLSQDIPYTFAKFNLFFAVLDAILFWLWGYSATNPIAWFLFIFALIRVGIAFILFRGVPEQSLLKCKSFCIGELILLILEIIFLFIKIVSIGYIIWTLFMIALRVYGIWIIGKFIRKVESDLCRSSTFPWTYFPQPVPATNSVDAPVSSHI